MAIVGRCATTLSLAGLLLLTLAASSRSEVSLKPSGFINDYVGLLSPEEKEKLENQAAGIEKKTTAEVAVVIVKELEGRNLEEYANELFNNWGIGKKGKDNGV
ncbi:MAG TPA: TPM domain-containing protein, partial [bacterium]|nr:TPM domain-containing protein [bacterium]